MSEIENKKQYLLIATDTNGQVVVELVVSEDRLRQTRKIYLEEGLQIEVNELVEPSSEGE